MKKVFAALVIAFVSIVFMSHNVGAITFTNDIEYVQHMGFPYFNITNSTGTWSCTSNCRASQQTAGAGGFIKTMTIKEQGTDWNFHFYEDDILELSLIVSSYPQTSLTTNSVPGVWLGGLRLSVVPVNGSAIDIPSYTTNVENITANAVKVKFYIKFEQELDLEQITIWNSSAPSYLFGVSASGSIAIDNAYLYKYVGSTGAKIDDLAETIENQQQQEVDATNDAVDNSQDAGQDSSDSATAGTGSLISAIGSAVAAITSASPTNCLINGNMGNLNVGQIDLCANPVPAFVSIIGSLLLVLFIVPLCISLFNRFINLFRSFQS